MVLRDAHSVSDLARRYPISFAAVHKHVGALERAGLVTKSRHGREQQVRGDVATLRTAPEGDRHRGWWRVRAVDPPSKLEFENRFADADGNPRPDTSTAMIRVVLSELAGGGTQMEITTSWPSVEAMEQMLATGMEAGMTAGVGQIDELLGLPARA